MWKNFTNGMMDHWLSESYAKETLDLDKTYDFLQGFSNMNASTFTMREAFDIGLEKYKNNAGSDACRSRSRRSSRGPACTGRARRRRT